jgi:PAS domain S-box-containing protein
VNDVARGAIEICYLEERPEEDEGPFLKEERQLIEGLAERLGHVIERKRAEEASRASEARFQSFMSHIPAVAYMIDASGRYLYINKAFEDAFDLKGSDIVGKTVEEVWPAATAAAFKKTDQQTLASQNGIELVEVVSHKDGLLEFMTFKFPVPEARGPSKVLGGVSIDITERRRVEKALRQANKKLNLLGSVTRHDAINQLSVLFAWLEIAKEVARDEPIQEHLTRVSEAAKAIQRQLEFTADYQDVGVKQPEWIDLASAANKGIEGLDKGKVSLNIDLVGVKVFADSMLEKVFHNLVENAIRHGEKVTSISISARETEEGLTIICEDDGVGVSADEKEKVFLRGFGKNTGFGLYMVREVLGITGMRIRETGVPGEGARFEMHVPSGNYKVSRQ